MGLPKNEGARLFAMAMRARGLTDEQAAGLLGGLHRTHIQKLRRSERLPGRTLALDIEEAFGVPARAWDEPAESAA